MGSNARTVSVIVAKAGAIGCGVVQSDPVCEIKGPMGVRAIGGKRCWLI